MYLDIEMPACRGDAASYHPRRLTQPPPPPLTQVPPRLIQPPPPLTQLAPRFAQPPPPPLTQLPRLLTQPASTLEPGTSAPRTTPPITAWDHVLRLVRKSLRRRSSTSSAVSAICCESLW